MRTGPHALLQSPQRLLDHLQLVLLQRVALRPALQGTAQGACAVTLQPSTRIKTGRQQGFAVLGPIDIQLLKYP
jgi:hypothetical protein